MIEENLEKNLRAFDFSQLSKVKESLLDELLQRHRMKNFKSLSQIMEEEKISDDELDYVAAAGNPNYDGENKKF